MPSRAITPTPKTYAQLRDAVTAVIVTGRLAIDRAWVDTCHETGRLINEHVLLFRERADYGTRVYEKLAEDTKVSVRTLRECAQFQRYFPIRRNCAELGWSQCRLLCQVADETERLKLLKQAVKNDWTVPELETRVRSYNAVALASEEAAPAALMELLTPRCGTPGLHPVVDLGAGPAVDLGFKIYRELGSTSNLTTKDIVRLNEDGVRKVDNATKAELFTYTATVRKVIDGDTLLVALAIAPGYTHQLKLRLRGLDCPELSAAAGRAAKAFVDARLKPGDEVIISTTKPDKYDRYLADVFVGELGARSSEPGDRISGAQPGAAPTFLNNALLEAGHAIRYDGGAKEE
jgi:endonuclease YncB( thermonuclease family)